MPGAIINRAAGHIPLTAVNEADSEAPLPKHLQDLVMSKRADRAGLGRGLQETKIGGSWKPCKILQETCLAEQGADQWTNQVCRVPSDSSDPHNSRYSQARA